MLLYHERLDTAESNDNGGLDIAGTADIGNSQHLEEDHTHAHKKLMTMDMCTEEACSYNVLEKIKDSYK